MNDPSGESAPGCWGPHFAGQWHGSYAHAAALPTCFAWTRGPCLPLVHLYLHYTVCSLYVKDWWMWLSWVSTTLWHHSPLLECDQEWLRESERDSLDCHSHWHPSAIVSLPPLYPPLMPRACGGQIGGSSSFLLACLWRWMVDCSSNKAMVCWAVCLWGFGFPPPPPPSPCCFRCGWLSSQMWGTLGTVLHRALIKQTLPPTIIQVHLRVSPAPDHRAVKRVGGRESQLSTDFWRSLVCHP